MADSFEYMRVHELHSVIEKLGGPSGAQKLLDGKRVVSDWFPNLHIYATLILGDPRQNAFSLRKRLEKNNIELTSNADELLNSPEMTFAEQEQQIEVIVVTPTDLGFKERDCPKVYDFLGEAKRFGLDLCPLEAGPRLCERVRPNEKISIVHKWGHRGVKTFEVIGKTEEMLRPRLCIDFIGDSLSYGRYIDLDTKYAFVRSKKLVYKLVLKEDDD